MPPRKRNIVTGIVVLGAMLILVWMILTFSGGAMRIFKPKGMPVVFRCERADGLSDGSPIFFIGVECGKVTSVHLLDNNEGVWIDGEVEVKPWLPENLTGVIRAQSSLGSSTQIDLTTNGAPTGKVAKGQEIKVKYVGQSLLPPEFSELLGQANKQELVKHIDDMVQSLHAQLDKAGKVIEDLGMVVGNPKLKQDVAAAMTNIREVTEKANAAITKFQTLTTDADVAVADVRKTLSQTDKNLNRLTLQIGDDLEKLGVVFAQFQEISAKINKGPGTAGQLINDPKLYDELTLTAKQLNSIASSLSRLVDQWEHEGVSIKLK